MMSITVISKKRAICPVCQRRSQGDWMGEVKYPEDSPEQWMWFAKPKTNAIGAGPSATSDPSNPTGVAFKPGFYKKGTSSLIAGWKDGEHRPRCFNGHKLAVLQPATMTDLLLKADAVGREWIAIPE